MLYIFFFVELLDIVLFFWMSNDRLFTRCGENKEISIGVGQFHDVGKDKIEMQCIQWWR